MELLPAQLITGYKPLISNNGNNMRVNHILDTQHLISNLDKPLSTEYTLRTMKYFLIIGILTVVFLLLWFTRNVNAQVIDTPTEPQNTITSMIFSEGSNCVTYNELHEVSKSYSPVQIVRCAR